MASSDGNYRVDNLTRLNISTGAPYYTNDDDSGQDNLLTEPYFVMRIIFSSLAIVANLLSLFAIANIKCAYTTHLRLTISLCMSDLLFSMFVITYTIFSVTYDINRDVLLYTCVSQAFTYVFYFSLVVTLLNIVAMALDHYLAIIRPLHYPIMMTRAKAIAGIAIIWTLTTVLAFSDWIAIAVYLPANATITDVCLRTNSDRYMPQFIMLPLMIVTLITIVLIYTKILVEIRRHHQRATNNPDLQKNRKALVTTLCIMGSYCVLWMPYFLFDCILTIRRVVSRHSFTRDEITRLVTWTNYLNMLVFLNALMDPIIYAIRMAEVQRSYVRLLNRVRRWLGKEPLYHRAGADTRTANAAPPTGNNMNNVRQQQPRQILSKDVATGANGSLKHARRNSGSSRRNNSNQQYNSMILQQNCVDSGKRGVCVYIQAPPRSRCQQTAFVANNGAINFADELL
ncbi:adenosine receptor A2b-like [Tubulanus polymorphus]|uniref:adenosine receptor A2b-like n=1 Tax=Tubulanus polymorphus TaxID=672921 RepID=UPI003DA691D0